MSTRLRNVDDVYPLTATQQGMLFHTLSDPASGVYMNQIVTPISGDLDIPRFEQVWDGLLARHETLRTGFVWDGLDDPVQVVRSEVSTEWRHLDLAGSSSSEQDRVLAEVLADDRRRGFDLANPPLSRMVLARVGPCEWKWVWSFHHLVLDGWSAHLILDELFAAYAGSGGGKIASAPKFRDFVAGYLARDEAPEEDFWRDRLAGFTEPHRLEVPGLPPAPGASGHKTYSFDLGAPASTAVATGARELNVTLNAMFLGAWALVLARWTRSTDVVFGTTVAGRPATLSGVEHATGLFINTLPQRVPVPPREQLGSWLRDVQRAHIETRDYEQSSLAAIQRWSDVEAGRPLFDSIVVFENYPRREQSNRFGGIEIGERTYLEQSNYPLAVLVMPGDSTHLSFIYDSAVFSDSAIESLASQLRVILTSMAAGPDERLASFGLTTAEDETWLRAAGTGPATTGDPTTVHEIIRQIAATRPEAAAVVDPAGSTTYRDLLVRADAMAARLAAAGVGPNRLVGLHLPRSTDMIAGMLGILGSGGAYVPLDPAYPAAHLHDLLTADGIEVVLTSSSLAAGVPDGVTKILIDGETGPADPVALQPATETDLAYVIHTSGSTGRPKGVMVTHENLVRSTRARSVHYDEPVGKFLLLSSFAFDSSVAGIFWALTTGGTLLLPAPDQERDVGSLLGFAQEQRATHLLGLPSLYEVLLEEAGAGQLDSLEVAIVAGEACPARVLDAHRNRLPDAELHNEYGPTEATVWCTAHRATTADEILPIGRPIAGTRVFLLDEHGNPVPPGFAGEICVAGTGVVPGYLGRPDLTAERFVSAPVLGEQERLYRTGDLGAWRSDGVLTFLGRSDTQLKIRGHRIEAAAVETALRSHPDIGEAVALGRSAPGRPAAQLVAYVDSDRDDLDVADLKRSLSAALPEFMVPDIVVPLREIPRLPNGKVDIGSLPDPRDHVQRTGGHIAPRSDGERVLAAIWSELLGVDAVGVQDDFFELGGDSIVSIRMISRARQAGIHIVPGQIAGHPTIEQLAAASNGESAPGNEPVTGSVPLGPIQQWFFDMNHAVPAQWNQSNLFAVPTEVDVTALDEALQACGQHHDMLRARFAHRDGTWEQWIDPDARLSLEIADEAADVDEIVTECHRSLDLESGPILRAVLIKRPPNEPNLLFLAVHHLVMDVVSWAILIDDLEHAYLQALAGEPASAGEAISLPPRSTSYRDWIAHLAADELEGDRHYWTDAGMGPSDSSPAVWGTEASQATVVVELEADITGLLLRGANDAYRTRPEELMVAALAPVLDSQTDGAVRVALERHGRPEDVAGVDLSRTIGWFTAQYPVTVNTGAGDVARLISATKETLRSVPNGGLGYGSLRYLHRLPELAGRPEPEYLFNYLGRAAADGSGVFRRVASADESSRHPSNGRSHRIEIVATVEDDKLAVMWHFSTLHDDPERVETMAAAHLDRLRTIVSHCMDDGAGTLTPSDFPAAGMDQDELDRFLDGLV